MDKELFELEEETEDEGFDFFDNLEEDGRDSQEDITEEIDMDALGELPQVDEDFDMEEIFETALFLDEQNRFSEDPFDGKYYTGYLGLNPLTVVKEKVEVLKSLVYLNFDQGKLGFLIKDLTRFNDGVKYLELDERDKYRSAESQEEKERIMGEIEKISSVYNRMAERIEALQDVYNIKTYKVEDNQMGRREITTENLAKNAEVQKRILLNAVSRPESTDKEVIRLTLMESVDELYGILSVIESYLKFSKNSDEKDSDHIKEYLERDYYYSKEEVELLTKLRFPMTYKGREHLEKIVPNIEETNKDKFINSVINEYEGRRIYNMYNVYNVTDNLINSNKRASDIFAD